MNPASSLTRKRRVAAISSTVPVRPSGIADTSGRPPAYHPAAGLESLPEPPEFLALFRYVRAKGYETEAFAAWFKRQA